MILDQLTLLGCLHLRVVLPRGWGLGCTLIPQATASRGQGLQHFRGCRQCCSSSLASPSGFCLGWVKREVPTGMPGPCQVEGAAFPN